MLATLNELLSRAKALNSSVLAFQVLGRSCPLAMSLAISQPTSYFLSLVEKAAGDFRDETISAKQQPITRINSMNGCKDVQNEFKESYLNKVRSNRRR